MNGWQNFGSESKNKHLEDDKTYVVRTKDAKGKWQCPHMAYWIAEENSFFLLHTATAIAPVVHQYCEIPE